MHSTVEYVPEGRWSGMASSLCTWPLRYWAGALIVHVVAGLTLYQIGPRQHEIKRQERQLAATARLSHQVRTEQRVHDLAQIKQLLEQSRAAARAADTAPQPVQFAATSLPKQPEELLKQARELAESIDVIDKDNRAEELARVLKITREEALAKVANEPPALAATAEASSAKDDVATEIARLEGQARSALKRREDQLARQGGGVEVNGGGSNGQGQGQGQGQGSQDIRQQIGAFIHHNIPAPANARGNSWDLNGFERSFASIPALDDGPVRRGAGRMIGNGGQYATRMFLDTWYVIGPFQGSRGSALFANKAYPPEQGVMLDAVYRGKDDRMVQWRYISGASYPFIPPDVEEGAVYYGYTELISDRDQQLEMWVGADDDVKVWVNDKLVWAKGNYAKLSFFTMAYASAESLGRDLNMNEGKQTVHLNQGRNKFFFKLSNGPSATFLSIVLSKKP